MFTYYVNSTCFECNRVNNVMDRINPKSFELAVFAWGNNDAKKLALLLLERLDTNVYQTLTNIKFPTI